MSFLSIFLCIVVLCSVTYAWFSSGTSNSNNKFAAGKFELDITVSDSKGGTSTVQVNADGTLTCTLEEGETYTVTMEMTGDTTVTKGFCYVSVNGGEAEKTAPISNDAAIGKNPFIFTIDAQAAGATVVFEPAWGLPAHEDVEPDGVLTVAAASAE